MSEKIQVILEMLADAESYLDHLRMSKQDAIDGVITPEIQQDLDDIEAEFGPDIEAAQSKIKEIEAKAKEFCVAAGQSFKGEHKRVTYYKGRTTWDSKGLEGYAVAHPEIEAFKKHGNPYAVVKNV